MHFGKSQHFRAGLSVVGENRPNRLLKPPFQKERGGVGNMRACFCW